uniref:Uncharacterized protein n=1 Tax=Setaria italica TaxID=4555 RepID=K3ZGP7_SETIT
MILHSFLVTSLQNALNLSFASAVNQLHHLWCSNLNFIGIHDTFHVIVA